MQFFRSFATYSFINVIINIKKETAPVFCFADTIVRKSTMDSKPKESIQLVILEANQYRFSPSHN